MKILIADAFDASLPKRLEKFGAVTSDMGELGTATVLLVRSKTKVTKEMVDQAPNLKLVIRGGVGLDTIDLPACKAKGIEVMNTAAASSVSVAEMAMAFMVAIPARLVEAHMGMKEGKFLKNELKRTELYQKTLGLIGAGAIASEENDVSWTVSCRRPRPGASGRQTTGSGADLPFAATMADTTCSRPDGRRPTRSSRATRHIPRSCVPWRTLPPGHTGLPRLCCLRAVSSIGMAA